MPIFGADKGTCSLEANPLSRQWSLLTMDALPECKSAVIVVLARPQRVKIKIVTAGKYGIQVGEE